MPAILAAAVAALVSVTIYWFTQRQAALERKRRASGEAIADALAWLELPYRIRRRVDDSPERLHDLSDRIHILQERLLYHENWLRVEIPQAHPMYRDLVREVKIAAGSAMQNAWCSSPITTADGMNIGDLDIRLNQESVEKFSKVVRRQLSILNC